MNSNTKRRNQAQSSTSDPKTIRQQLADNNRITIFRILFLVIFFFACMVFILICSDSVVDYSKKLQQSMESIVDINEWMGDIENSIQNSVAFTNETDISQTNFQQFYELSKNESGSVAKKIDTAYNLYTEVFSLGIDTLTISKSGTLQESYMKNIEAMIRKISDSISDSAAASEETAAMSEEINKNAETLIDSVSQFTLRRRITGKPYIPPEKQNDSEFIKIATENYEKYMRSLQS